MNRVRAALESDQTALALHLAESAGRTFGKDLALDLALGQSLLAFGYAQKARSFFEKANQLAPSNPEVALPLARVCLRERDDGCARKALSSIGADASSAEYHYLLGETYVLENQGRSALAEVKRACELQPLNSNYLLTLGRLYQKLGMQEQALLVLTRTAQLNSRSPEIPYSIGVSYFIQDKFDLADREADRALSIDPRDDKALFLLALSRYATGKLNEAGTALNKAMELAPRNPFYVCFYGMLLLTESHPVQASQCFRESLALDPDYALAHYHMGGIFEQTHNYEAARRELERAVSLEPGLVEAYYRLARVYRRLGDVRKAHQALATFEKYHAAQYNEREEMLLDMHHAVR